MQLIWTKFGICQGVTTFRKFWVRSVHFGQNGGWDESLRARVFFVVQVNHATFWQFCNSRFLPNLVAKCTSVSRRGIRKDIFENFHIRGNFPPKSEIENWSNGHLTQNRLQVKGCTVERYCLLRDVVQGHGVSEVRSTLLCDVRLRSYGASKLPNFRILAYFLYTKPLKRTFRWPPYSPGVTSQNDSDLSMW